MVKREIVPTAGRESFSEKGLKQIEKIVKVAARLFNKKGYLETNMDDISAAARISKGGIYHYFSSKDEILFFMLTNYMDIILHNLEEDLQGFPDASSQIHFIIRRHITLYTQHLHEAKTLLHEAHCLPARFYRTIAEKQREYYRIVAGSITELLGGEGRVKRSKITVVVFMLFGMCNWIYSWYDPRGEVGPDELAEIIWTLFLKGVEEFRA